MVAAAVAPKQVSRVYARRDGARAMLSYRESPDGRHRVSLSGQEDAAVWNCETVEDARARWKLLAERLRDNGFTLPRASR